MQTYFAPLQGFDLNVDTINTFIANAAIDFGKLAVPAKNTGYLSAATGTSLRGMYFLLQHVVDGSTDAAKYQRLFNYSQGIYEFQVYAGTSTAVGVLIPKPGAIIRTKHVAKGDGGADIAEDQTVNVTSGVFTTTASNDGTCGKILNKITDSKGNVLYDIILF
jgi:hypothetical protein